MLEQLQASISRLLPPGQGLLVAVSGGRDSMVLLHALRALNPAGPERRLMAAHLNHRLRGIASDRDAALVEAECQRLGIPLETRCCEPGELEASQAGSLEEAARTRRYEYLASAARRHDFTAIATAHHASDQAETVLFNLFRGTGLRGLRGMPERRMIHDSDVQIIRPMLGIPTEIIRDYAQQHGLVFADDATNADDRFARNRIRNVILPMLEEQFNGRAASAVLRLAEQAGEALECLDALADRLLESATLERSRHGCRLKSSVLMEAPSFLCRHALNRLWIVNGWPRQSMTFEHWRRLSGLVSGESVGPVDLPGGVRAELSRGVVRIGWNGGR